MHHIFISLAGENEKKVTGMALIRTNEKGVLVKTYAGSITDTKDFNKLCDEAYKELVYQHDESYVVIVDGIETLNYFHKNKIELFDKASWFMMSQLAWPLVFSGMLPGREIEQIAALYGVENTAPGTATGNCEFLGRTYWKMMRSMRLALLAEEGMRDYGGKIVANVRGILGI